MTSAKENRLVEGEVTYSINMDDRLIVIEHVPARIDEETGERFYSPETVERLQRITRQRKHPSRTIEALVFDFAA